MPVRLSNSSTNMLEMCGKHYEYHYVKRIRSKFLGSALFFGVAIDEALNELLMQKHKTDYISQNEAHDRAMKAFYRCMTHAKVNGKDVNITEYPYVQYVKADLDLSLIEQVGCEEWVEEYYQRVRDGLEIDDKSRIAYNSMCHASLMAKGEMLINHYQEEIIPQIEEVLQVQQSVELPNESGDTLTGIIDAVLKFKGDDYYTIVDNKTAGKAYKESDLTNSKQLATYAEYLENENVAYIVLEKGIRKKDPRVRSQVLKGRVSANLAEKVFLDYEASLLKIRDAQFAKNEKNCFNWYGKPCVYVQLCKYGKMPDHLEEK